jgi:hypothetical protein
MDEKAIFEDVNYTLINNLVEEKIPILRKNQDFNAKYTKFFEILEKLENDLTGSQKALLDELIELNYKTEEYYMALAYSLGVKYRNDLEKI